APNRIVRMAQRLPAGRQRMREERGIEVEFQPLPLRPLNPTGEMLGLELRAFHTAPAGFGINRMQVHAVAAWDHPQAALQITTQFVGRPRLAGVVARYRQPAVEPSRATFKPANVVPLPAMQRNARATQPLDCPLRIDA